MYMRHLFPGYHQPTEDDFRRYWETGLFVFDTNVLLNLYRFSSEHSTELLNIIERLSARIWIPHQVAQEFYKNRSAVLNEQVSTYDKLINQLAGNKKKYFETLDNEVRNRHPYIDIERIKQLFEDSSAPVAEYLNAQKESHPDLFNEDIILNRLEELFSEKVGTHYSPERLFEIYRLGKERQELRMAPGVLDSTKDGTSQYGDLIIWFQMIDKAREFQGPIIFITDEEKADWWEGRRGKLTGPKPELIQEMRIEANAELYIYSSAQFLRRAGEFLGTSIDPGLVAEVNAVVEHEKKKLSDLANDRARLEKLITNEVVIQPVEKATEELITKLIIDHFSPASILQSTKLWLDTLNLSDTERENFLNAINFKSVSEEVQSALIDKINPKEILSLIRQEHPELGIDITKFQSELQKVVAQFEQISQENRMQQIETILRTSMNFSIVEASLSQLIEQRVKAVDIEKLITPSLRRAMKSIGKIP